jgi:hypothetical protein
MSKILIFLAIGMGVTIAFLTIHHQHTFNQKDPNLEKALTYLFCNELGYTLIGAKPISDEECCWLNEFPPSTKKALIRYLRRIFGKSNTYIINIYTPTPKYTSITLVYKPALLNAIATEPYLQAFVKKNFGTEKKLFHELKKNNVFKCFKWNDIALGIVFGYGIGNVEYANRLTHLGLFLKKYPDVCLFAHEPKPDPFFIIRPIPRFFFTPASRTIPQPKGNPLFSSFEHEWKWLQDQAYTFPRSAPPIFFSLPTFLAKTGEETSRIVKKYFQTRDALAKLYCEKTFTKGIEDWVRGKDMLSTKKKACTLKTSKSHQETTEAVS